MRTVGDELVILFGTLAEAERAARALGIVDREIRPVRFVAPRTGSEAPVGDYVPGSDDA